jgi:hypothetical protein
VPVRGPLVRLLWWIGTFGSGVLAVVGGLGLLGPGLVAVGVAGMLAACTAVGIAREVPGHDSRSVLESGGQASARAAGGVRLVGGVAVLAGGLVALLVGAAGITAWLLARAARSRKPARRASAVAPWPMGVEVLPPVSPPEGAATSDPADRAWPPVSMLATPALGREWIRTSAALGGSLTPADRQALVRRRGETLDELERRDPAGFACWLADGPAPGSDPTDYVPGPAGPGGSDGRDRGGLTAPPPSRDCQSDE